jgi:hypothetical protein
VQIAIWDAAGKTVRTLRGSSQAGLNRACWDLRRERAMGDGNAPGFASCGAVTRGDAGPLAPPAKYTVVVTPAGVLPMKSELTVLPDPRSRVSEADRQARETAIESAYSLQQQLRAARAAAQILGGQIGAMRASVSGEAAAQLERCSRDLARALAELSAAITGASRAQTTIDAYEGAPTSAQIRELNWAWEDAIAGVAGLNQLIDEAMPPLYSAAGASSRWTPLKPVPPPMR